MPTSTSRIIFLVSWPALKKTFNYLIIHRFLATQNHEYHRGYQAEPSQFGFESGIGPITAALSFRSKPIGARILTSHVR